MIQTQEKEPTVLYRHTAGYFLFPDCLINCVESNLLTRISFGRSKVRGAILDDTEDDT